MHTMAGSLSSCDSWFNNPSAVVSAHYGIGFDGEIHQYVRDEDMAYANGVLEPGNRWPYQGMNPNYITISIETEGDVGDIVTDEMFESVKFLVGKLVDKFPEIELMSSHNVISPNTRPNCAGDRWTDALIYELGLPVLV